MAYKINFLTVLGLVSAAAATTHNINVGKNGLTFEPNVTTAAVGDTLVFHYYTGRNNVVHNVVQGTFASPCRPLSGGFFSGFIGGEANEAFTVMVNDTNPIWIYCSQIEHCQLGMAGVINAPPSGDTLEAYVSAAARTSNSITPAAVAGGVISPDSTSSSSSSSLTASSSSSPSTASMTSATGASVATAMSGSASMASITQSGPAQFTGAANHLKAVAGMGAAAMVMALMVA